MDATLAPAIIAQINSLSPTHSIYVVIALIVLSILMHAGSWTHLSKTLNTTLSKCFEAEVKAETTTDIGN